MRVVLCGVFVCMASAAMADPFADQGYAVGCDAEGSPIACYIVASGFNLAVMQDGGTPPDVFDALQGLPVLTAVSFSGRIGEMGDSSAEVVLDSLTMVPDDLYEGNLSAMQGRWRPVGEETPFFIEIAGMDWLEVAQDEVVGAYLMSVGELCGDGTLPGNGMAISLYRYGDDPADDACWRLEYVDETTLELRDFKGEQGAVTFNRAE
jgi:hypothetical protein